MCASSFLILVHIGLGSLIIGSGSAANVLGIFTFPGQSNFHFNKAILESLHEAGHSVTFLTTYAAAMKSTPNFTVVDIAGGQQNLVGKFSPEFAMSLTVVDRSRFLFSHEAKFCSNVVNSPTIQDALASNIKFDVLLTQFLFGPQCQLKIAEALGIPIIGTIAFHQEMPSTDTGNPLNPSFAPHPLSVFSRRMSFTQRLINSWYYIGAKYVDETVILPAAKKFYRQHFPESPAPPTITPALFFVNSHSSLLARSLVPNFVEIAGVHIHRAKPLNSMLQKFIDEAEHGVILFTFGSVVTPSQMPANAIASYVRAFASIPQRVIWKYDQPLENVSNNVLLSDWVPQRDLLEHENVIAFISHCGLSGTLEAIHTGTPVVAAPLFADQPSNALLLQENGAAVPLSAFTSSTEQILDALNKIVNDTEYFENMQKLSKRFKDRPLTPQQTIAYWTEYVIRHKGAPHLRTVAADMPLYQYLLVDVILFVCCVLAMVLYALHFVLTRTMRKFKRKFPARTTKKKD